MAIEQVNEAYELVKLRMPAWTTITPDGKFIYSEEMIEIESMIIVKQGKDERSSE